MQETENGDYRYIQQIKNRKMDEIICALETADRSELLERVIEDVGSSYHVTHFRDGMLSSTTMQRWNAIVTTSKHCLLELVLVLYQLYIDKLQLCRKGKEKFTWLQLAWMETGNTRRISPDRRSKRRRKNRHHHMTGRLLASSTVYSSPLWLREPLARLVHHLQPSSVSLSVSL